VPRARRFPRRKRFRMEFALFTLSLYDRYLALAREHPALRAIEQAAVLGVSEAELTAARCDAGAGIALRCKPAALLSRIADVGAVMGLSRNANAVLENVGVYAESVFDNEHAGLVMGPGIDMRVFPRAWAYAFALEDRENGESLGGPADPPVRRSLQFFGADGVAVHKIYPRVGADLTAYERIVAEFADRRLLENVTITPAAPTSELADDRIDTGAYREAIAGMRDTHDFALLLRRFGLRREQGLRLAGPTYAVAAARDAYRDVFVEAHRTRLPIMLFVANDGIVQIFTGPIPFPVARAPWYNLMQPSFNLHLREDGVARAWIVRKPTASGIITSLELYDDAGELILQVFGERHDGEAERDDWRALIAQVAPR
jgi:putative hemin transport protein